MDKDELKIIGINLQRLRKQAGLSRRQFAETYNLAESTIKLWELGQVEMGIIKLRKYLEFFQDFGIYVDLNTLVQTANNINDHINEAFQKFYQLSIFLENIGQGNTLFYIKTNREIIYFNPRYKHFLDTDQLSDENGVAWYIDSIFDTRYCDQILTKTTEKHVINVSKKLQNFMLKLEIELCPTVDVDNNMIGVTGFLLSQIEQYNLKH